MPLQERYLHMATSGNKKVARVLITDDEELMEINTPQGPNLKRATGKAMDTSEKNNKKKSKSGEMLCVTIPKKLNKKYWLGFHYMEQLATEEGTPECYSDGSVEDLVIQGYIRIEVEELEQAIISYPKIPQKLYPSKRSDKVLDQYYNLTQIPFEVETNPKAKLSLDFHVTIYFEQPRTSFEHDEILAKAMDRF